MPYSRIHESHREYQERLERLRDREFAPARVRAIWNLDDTLKLIDAAELALIKGCSHWARQVYQATLAGRTPEQARADALQHFARTHSDAVAAERLHAQLIEQVAA